MGLWVVRARLLLIAFGLVLGLAGLGTADAAVYREIDDAGELPGTVVNGGAASRIEGTLRTLSGGRDDVDMYRMTIERPTRWGLTVDADLTGDNDLSLFIFDLAGNFVFYDDDREPGPDDRLPLIRPGTLRKLAAGDYLVAIALSGTVPYIPGNSPITAWYRAPAAFQTGPYSLTVTPLPLPAAMLGAGLAALISLRLRRRRSEGCNPSTPPGRGASWTCR